MTHPTIEASCHKMGLEPEAGHGRYMPAAARVILSAQVSDAEVEAALVANYGKAWAKFTNGSKMAARANMRIGITAFLKQRRKELGVG